MKTANIYTRGMLPVVLSVLCFLASVGGSAQTADVESFLQYKMKELRIPGLQVAVVRQGRIVFLKSYGVANLQDSVPVTPKSIFSLNSCTRAFTGVAIMQLVEEGKVDLSAPVSKYLDGLPAAWRRITVRQLLTNVSGLPDIVTVTNQFPRGVAAANYEDKAWEKLMEAPLRFPTGEQFSYSQTNYVLLGKIIEKINEKPFDQTFAEKQFSIARMPNTCFGDSRDIIPNIAWSYKYQTKNVGQKPAKAKLTCVYEEFPAFLRTSAGINSNAEDIANWIIALQQGKLLKSKDALNMLWTPGTFNNGASTRYALGWISKPLPNHRSLVAVGGGRAAYVVYPDDDLAVVVLTNLAGSYPQDFINKIAGYYNPEISLADSLSAMLLN